MYDVHTILRILVFATFCLAALVALAGWLVRTRRVSPFGGLGRTLRSVTDPVLRPVEARLVRLGGNPVHAGWWLVRSEEHTSELQSRSDLVCRLLLEKKKTH